MDVRDAAFPRNVGSNDQTVDGSRLGFFNYNHDLRGRRLRNPRDLFDVMQLFAHEGITPPINRARSRHQGPDNGSRRVWTLRSREASCGVPKGSKCLYTHFNLHFPPDSV
ncbi:MAG: hypothetical protein E6K41_02375 [Gammaproteobacteria bacterium]|nr:MAG: hypothetical protein E6K41_02375 [Gammaproteobacteria bacterium]